MDQITDRWPDHTLEIAVEPFRVGARLHSLHRLAEELPPRVRCKCAHLWMRGHKASQAWYVRAKHDAIHPAYCN